MKYKIGEICVITEDFVKETLYRCDSDMCDELDGLADFLKEFVGKKVRITNFEVNKYVGGIYTVLLLNPFKYTLDDILNYSNLLDYAFLANDIDSTDDAIYLLFYEKELNKQNICYEI